MSNQSSDMGQDEGAFTRSKKKKEKRPWRIRVTTSNFRNDDGYTFVWKTYTDENIAKTNFEKFQSRYPYWKWELFYKE